jgi:hypothetical protein
MDYPVRNGMNYDPVEDTEEYKKVIKKVEKELERQMKDWPQGLGQCHIYWNLKKRLLAEYGVNWRSPSECNTHIIFD